MLHAARRGYLQKIEDYIRLSNTTALLSNENTLLKVKLFGKSSEKGKRTPDPQVFDEAKAGSQVLEEDTPIVMETSDLDATLTNVETPEKETKKKGRKPIPVCYSVSTINGV